MTTRVSARQFATPHGTFYSLATQAIANVANVQAIAFEYDDDVHGFTHSTVTNNSRIYAPYTGSYEIIVSGIADLSRRRRTNISNCGLRSTVARLRTAIRGSKSRMRLLK